MFSVIRGGVILWLVTRNLMRDNTLAYVLCDAPWSFLKETSVRHRLIARQCIRAIQSQNDM